MKQSTAWPTITVWYAYGHATRCHAPFIRMDVCLVFSFVCLFWQFGVDFCHPFIFNPFVSSSVNEGAFYRARATQKERERLIKRSIKRRTGREGNSFELFPASRLNKPDAFCCLGKLAKSLATKWLAAIENERTNEQAKRPSSFSLSCEGKPHRGAVFTFSKDDQYNCGRETDEPKNSFAARKLSSSLWSL